MSHLGVTLTYLERNRRASDDLQDDQRDEQARIAGINLDGRHNKCYIPDYSTCIQQFRIRHLFSERSLVKLYLLER